MIHSLFQVGTLLALAVVLYFLTLMSRAGRLPVALATLPRWQRRQARGLYRRLLADAGVVSLAQAKLSATDDIDLMVIDEFRKQGWLMEALQFDDVVNASGNGSTLTYGYQRLISQATAGFRAINAEYTPQEVTKARYSVDLKPLGGSFQIDRVLAGIAAGAEVTLQMQQKIKASYAQFLDAFINGDTSVDANGFDGISKAVTGTATELGATAGTDFSTIAYGNDTTFVALDVVDELLALLDGPATALIGNRLLLAKLRGVARRAGYYTQDIVNFEDSQGFLRVEKFGNVVIVDAGTKAGSNTDIIPVTNKTVGGVTANYTDLYAVRLGMDGVHGVTVAGAPLAKTWLPDFERAGAVKTGEVELGPLAVAVKATKALAVRRNIKLS